MKLIFINTLPTAKIFGNKVDTWWFKQNGFDVEFWDISPCYWNEKKLELYYGGAEDYRYVGPSHKIFNNLQNVLSDLEQLNKNTQIFYLSRTYSKHVNDDIIIKKIKSLPLSIAFQGFHTPYNTGNSYLKIKNILRITRQKIQGFGVHPNVFFGCGSVGRSLAKRIYPKANFISIPSPKIYWGELTKILDYEYNVFIDENLEYMPDAELLELTVIKDIAGYYKRINKVFEVIENETGLPIVIAASGKYIYKNNPFFGRDIIYGKTFQLIEHASLLIGHSSSALEQNIKVKKPILHLDDISFMPIKRNAFNSVVTLENSTPIMSHKFSIDILKKVYDASHTNYLNIENKYFREIDVDSNYKKIIKDTFVNILNGPSL